MEWYEMQWDGKGYNGMRWDAMGWVMGKDNIERSMYNLVVLYLW